LTSIAPLLARLEACLRRAEFDGRWTFRPGLSRRVILDRTAKLPFKLPEEVVALYEWSDGHGSITPGKWFMPLEDSVQSYQRQLDWQRQEAPHEEGRRWDDWSEDWFPLFSNSYCESFVRCGPLAHGQLWDRCPQFLELNWLADSLAEFIETIVVSIESGGLLIHPLKGKGLDMNAGYNAFKQTRPDGESLVQAVNGNDPLERARAFGILRQGVHPAVIGPMTELVLSHDAELAEAAAWVLRAIDQPAAMASLIKAAVVWGQRPDSHNPVLHMIPHGRHADSQPLIDALGDNDDALRLAAVTCLGLLAQATDFPSLYAATSDSSPAVRAAARAALDRLNVDRT
jgi:hypothetical protein